MSVNRTRGLDAAGGLSRILAGVLSAVFALAMMPSMVLAQATIYRCHALDGQLIFQDKPCDQVTGTQEARKGSAGEIIPNAPPAPDVEGPALTERYETYLDAQAARRAKEAAATPPPEQSPPASASARQTVTAPNGGTETYSGYSEGYYPYPVYPYPVYRDRPPIHSNTAPQAPIYNQGGQLPLPTILPAPGLSLSPQNNVPRPLPPPGRLLGRDPNH